MSERLTDDEVAFIQDAWDAIPVHLRGRTRKRVALGMALEEMKRARLAEKTLGDEIVQLRNRPEASNF